MQKIPGYPEEEGFTWILPKLAKEPGRKTGG